MATAKPGESAADVTVRIDQLLEEYLHLLNQYTRERDGLQRFQAAIHQNISRANFSAERGIRYGPDSYGPRLQATRRCTAMEKPWTMRGCAGDTPLEGFELAIGSVEHDSPAPESSPEDADDKHEEKVGPSTDSNVADSVKPSRGGKDTDDDTDAASPADQASRRDPINMFGMMIPSALRIAQRDAIAMLEKTVPRLLVIDAQMRAVEIDVRRARKLRKKLLTGKPTDRHVNGVSKDEREGLVAALQGSQIGEA